MKRLRNNLQRRLNRWLQWIWQQEGTPGQRARGLAAGVFCGCFPFFGFQTLLGIGLASVVRGNHLLAAAGTLVSNPITYLPLYWFNYLVGCQLLGPGRGGINLAELNRSTLWAQGSDFSQRILLGSTVVGMVLAIVSGWMAYRLFLRREAHAVVSRGS